MCMCSWGLTGHPMLPLCHVGCVCFGGSLQIGLGRLDLVIFSLMMSGFSERNLRGYHCDTVGDISPHPPGHSLCCSHSLRFPTCAREAQGGKWSQTWGDAAAKEALDASSNIAGAHREPANTRDRTGESGTANSSSAIS